MGKTKATPFLNIQSEFNDDINYLNAICDRMKEIICGEKKWHTEQN